MKTLLLFLSFLFLGKISSCQIKSIIIDSVTRENIPYVNIWVENENIGTTSNEEGEFELNVTATNKIILFSAIGYESTKMKAGSIGKEVMLVPQIPVLKEVLIYSKKGTRELIIERFKKSESNHSFVGGVTPWILAKYFGYQDDYESTPYLKKINILTNSEIKNATFNIRLYSVGEDGNPGEYLYEKNIIGIAKKGKTITEVDLSTLNIRFPQNGFFIAYEWLIIESNRHEYSYTVHGSKEEFKGIRYEPAIASLKGNEDKNSWMFTKGNWKKWNGLSLKEIVNRYRYLAIELILTN